ncbi:MAG: rod shape-determining protein MreC [Patescibacteria group bacterium]
MITFKSRYFKYISIFLVIILMIIFLRSYFWDYLLTYLQPVSGTPIFIGYRVSRDVDDQFNNTFHKSTLTEQIALLENELSMLQNNESKIENLTMENIRLRQELDLLPSYNFTTTGAEIIGRRESPATIVFVINKGNYHNIKNGLPVIAGNVLVGKVVNVQKMFSEIALITSPLALANAEVLNTNNSRGIIQGEFNLGTRLNYLPVDDVVETGQTVITSGLDELIPRGLIIGKIMSVEKKEDNFFQSAILLPAIDLTKLRFLQIVTANITLN